MSKRYHLTVRGQGRRILFEDDEDRSCFVDKFAESAAALVQVYAWCLMDNHVHIVLKGELPDIAKLMRSVCTYYASFFNGRHGHVGHVFQGRYHTTPIEKDAHLLEAIRYVHLNPRDLGLNDMASYKWSSFAQYLGKDGFCNTESGLELFGGLDGFLSFHDIGSDELEMVQLGHRARISDYEADGLAKTHIGPHYEDALSMMNRDDRDRNLAKLYALGLSIRQIERLSGIGRGIIHAAVKRHRFKLR